jgi:hypothetical protein
VVQLALPVMLTSAPAGSGLGGFAAALKVQSGLAD